MNFRMISAACAALAVFAATFTTPNSALAGGGGIPQQTCVAGELSGQQDDMTWYAYTDSCGTNHQIQPMKGMFGVDFSYDDGSGWGFVTFGAHAFDELGTTLYAYGDENCLFIESGTNIEGPREDYIVGIGVCEAMPEELPVTLTSAIQKFGRGQNARFVFQYNRVE